MTMLQIRNWSLHFENNRSRSRDKCSFVCVPNKQHGMGFCRIMAEPDGAAIYGIWQMILGACSQQSAPRNGILTFDGTITGKPWTSEDLALKFRRPVKEIDRAIEFLSSENVGWIDKISPKCPSGDRPVPAECPPSDLPVPRKKERIEGSERIESGVQAKDLLKDKLAELFKRGEHDRPSYAEESLLAEVARRPAAIEEFGTLLKYRKTMKDRQFFPHSAEKLLQNWQPTLDRARQNVNGAPRSGY